MSRSVLFGYSVERDDGKIIITLSGSMAGNVINRLSSRGSRRGASALPFLTETLGSPSISLAPLFEGETECDIEETSEPEPDLKDIFGQGFDRSYEDFESRLIAYRSVLSACGDEEICDDEIVVETPPPAKTPAPAPVAVVATASEGVADNNVVGDVDGAKSRKRASSDIVLGG